MPVSDHVSITESLFYQALRTYLPSLPFQTHLEPSWLKNPDTRRQLHLDIGWPELKLALEVQGNHHYRNIRRFGDTSGQRKRDTYKRQLCQDNGWLLLEADIHALTEARMRLIATKVLDRAAQYPASRLAASRDRSRLYLARLPLEAATTANRFASMGIKRQVIRPYRKPGFWPLIQRTYRRLHR